MQLDAQQLLHVCHEAGLAIMKIRKSQALGVRHKQDQSPVTLADQAAHEIIVRQLAKLYPHVPVISEESELPPLSIRKNYPTYFCIDPLDGTWGFIQGKQEFTVNIALIHHHRPVAGFIYAPCFDHFYFAQSGGGAFLQKGVDGVATRIRAAEIQWDRARVLVSDTNKAGPLTDFQKTYPHWSFQGMHSSLKLARLASGDAQFYVRFAPISEWDVAAGDAIVCESGGCMVDFSGNLLQYNQRENFIINPLLAMACNKNTSAVSRLLKQLGEYDGFNA